jgi:hypothetical protein
MPSDSRAVPNVVSQPDTRHRAQKNDAVKRSSEAQHYHELLPRVASEEAKALNSSAHSPTLAGRPAIHSSLIVEAKEVPRTYLPSYLIPVPKVSPVRERAVPAPAAGVHKPSIVRPPQVKPGSIHEIHVTIGRVEVRAMPPSTPARAKPKKESEMSLEAYLQRRAEGDRR